VAGLLHYGDRDEIATGSGLRVEGLILSPEAAMPVFIYCVDNFLQVAAGGKRFIGMPFQILPHPVKAPFQGTFDVFDLGERGTSFLLGIIPSRSNGEEFDIVVVYSIFNSLLVPKFRWNLADA
jgi:hypothetical protein